MPRPRNLPTLDRAQGARPAPAVGPEVRDAERALPGALQVPIEQILPDPGQPRQHMDPAQLAELAASIAAYGVLQPLLVRADGYLADGRTRYLIVAGGRRYAAAQQAAQTRLPVLIRDSEGATLRILQLSENLQREALDPLDEARAFKEIMDLENASTRDLAARLHRSHTYVADRLRLIQSAEVADAVAEGKILPTVGISIAREKDPQKRHALLERAEHGRLGKRDIQQMRRSETESGEASASDVPPSPLAMPATDAPLSRPARAPRGPRRDPGRIIAAAGGPAAILAVLDWAQQEGMDLAALRRAVQEVGASEQV